MVFDYFLWPTHVWFSNLLDRGKVLSWWLSLDYKVLLPNMIAGSDHARHPRLDPYALNTIREVVRGWYLPPTVARAISCGQARLFSFAFQSLLWRMAARWYRHVAVGWVTFVNLLGLRLVDCVGRLLQLSDKDLFFGKEVFFADDSGFGFERTWVEFVRLLFRVDTVWLLHFWLSTELSCDWLAWAIQVHFMCFIELIAPKFLTCRELEAWWRVQTCKERFAFLLDPPAAREFLLLSNRHFLCCFHVIVRAHIVHFNVQSLNFGKLRGLYW